MVSKRNEIKRCLCPLFLNYFDCGYIALQTGKMAHVLSAVTLVSLICSLICGVFSDIDLLNFQSQDSNNSFQGSLYYSIAMPTDDDQVDENPVARTSPVSNSNLTKTRTQDHSIIDMEYNQTSNSTNMTFGDETLMTSDIHKTPEEDVVFTSAPPRQDFLPIGESKKYFCQAEENSKVINTHWIIPMSVNTYSAAQHSRPGFRGYVSMNASVLEIINMQADFAGIYMCIGYGENGTLSRQMELDTAKMFRTTFSLRITIGLSAFGGVISLLLLTVLFCKIKHLFLTKFRQGKVKPHKRKTVHFKTVELELITAPISKAAVHPELKESPLLEKENTEVSFHKGMEDTAFKTPSSENGHIKGETESTCIPILLVNGENTDPDLNIKRAKIESPKEERSAPRFKERRSSVNTNHGETRF